MAIKKVRLECDNGQTIELQLNSDGENITLAESCTDQPDNLELNNVRVLTPKRAREAVNTFLEQFGKTYDYDDACIISSLIARNKM